MQFCTCFGITLKEFFELSYGQLHFLSPVVARHIAQKQLIDIHNMSIAVKAGMAESKDYKKFMRSIQRSMDELSSTKPQHNNNEPINMPGLEKAVV